MTCLKHFKVDCLIVFILWLTACTSESSTWRNVIDSVKVPKHVDTIIILHEKFCRSCIYSTEEYFSNGFHFKKNVSGFYIVATSNQRIEDEIKKNFIVLEENDVERGCFFRQFVNVI